MIERIAKIGLGIGLLWLGVLRGAKGLVVRMKSYQFAGLNEDGTVRLILNLLVKNPLLVGLTIKGVKGDVYAQGYQVGIVDTVYDYYLAGGKTHVLPVYVDLNITEAWSALLANINSGDVRTLTIAFNGKIYVGSWNVGIPLQFEMDYNGLTA